MRLNGTAEAIQTAEYPITSDELKTKCADHDIELHDGTESVATVLGRLGDETYERPEDALFALYAGVSNKAIGRKGYSDRDPTPPGAVEGHDQLSF